MKIKISLLLLLAAMILGGYWHYKNFSKVAIWEVPKLLSSMRAKEFCSCHFVLGKDWNECLERVKMGYPLFAYEIDPVGKSASFSILFARATAKVKSQRLGCSLQ